MAKRKKKSLKKNYPYVQAEDGDTRMNITTSFPMTCCDCGLRHFITIYEILPNGMFKPNKHRLALSFYRDYSMTEHNREVKKWKKN